MKLKNFERWANISEEDLERVRNKFRGENNPMFGRYKNPLKIKKPKSEFCVGRPGHPKGLKFSDEHKEKLKTCGHRGIKCRFNNIEFKTIKDAYLYAKANNLINMGLTKFINKKIVEYVL